MQSKITTITLAIVGYANKKKLINHIKIYKNIVVFLQ